MIYRYETREIEQILSELQDPELATEPMRWMTLLEMTEQLLGDLKKAVNTLHIYADSGKWGWDWAAQHDTCNLWETSENGWTQAYNVLSEIRALDLEKWK